MSCGLWGRRLSMGTIRSLRSATAGIDDIRFMFALLLLLLGLLFCWLLYKGAVYALPCLAGLCTGQWAYETGAGWTGAIVVALITAVTAFMLARVAYANAASVVLRRLLAACFVAPTLVMSYNIAIDLLAGAVASSVWLHLLGGAFALLMGMVALRRLTEDALDAG